MNADTPSAPWTSRENQRFIVAVSLVGIDYDHTMRFVETCDRRKIRSRYNHLLYKLLLRLGITNLAAKTKEELLMTYCNLLLVPGIERTVPILRDPMFHLSKDQFHYLRSAYRVPCQCTICLIVQTASVLANMSAVHNNKVCKLSGVIDTQ